MKKLSLFTLLACIAFTFHSCVTHRTIGFPVDCESPLGTLEFIIGADNALTEMYWRYSDEVEEACDLYNQEQITIKGTDEADMRRVAIEEFAPMKREFAARINAIKADFEAELEEKADELASIRGYFEINALITLDDFSGDEGYKELDSELITFSAGTRETEE